MRMLLKCLLTAIGAAGLLMAQHGGGGGHHGGGGGSFGGGSFSGSHSFSAHTSSAPAYSGYRGSSSPRVIYPTPLGLQPSYSGFTGINRGAYGNSIRYGAPYSGFRYGRPLPFRPFGFGYYPFWGLGYGDNWYDPAYDYDYNAPAIPYQMPNQDNPYAAMPDPSVETGPGYYYPPVPYVGGPEMQQPQEPAPVAQPASPVVLILKSGQRVEVQNYAIMNGVFWDFTKQNSHRIPLTDIDVAASAKATDEAGGLFPEESFATSPR